jgi:hypothetical protein
MQLDERADPAQRLLVPADLLGRVTGCGHCLGHRHAVSVPQASGLAGIELAGDQTGPGAGDAESRPLLVDEVRHRDGT